MRDLPYVVSRGLHGATTVASTMRLAALAGIGVFVTGGLGGVHRGAETSYDVSADLTELSTTSVAVVCAGVKSILDIGLTLEKLETLGVPVLGYGTDEFPSFFSRSSGFGAPMRVDSPAEVAALMRAKWDLGLDGGVVVANPIPAESEIPADEIGAIIDRALADMDCARHHAARTRRPTSWAASSRSPTAPRSRPTSRSSSTTRASARPSRGSTPLASGARSNSPVPVGTMSLPSGASEIGMSLRSASASGMPMIVTASATADRTCAMTSHQPASTNQITLPMNDPTPADGLATMVRPNGQSAKPAIRKAAIAHGIVMIGMHSSTPAST